MVTDLVTELNESIGQVTRFKGIVPSTAYPTNDKLFSFYHKRIATQQESVSRIKGVRKVTIGAIRKKAIDDKKK
jgi:hypothetical protein